MNKLKKYLLLPVCFFSATLYSNEMVNSNEHANNLKKIMYTLDELEKNIV